MEFGRSGNVHGAVFRPTTTFRNWNTTLKMLELARRPARSG
jgi:hypothetical protein